MNGTLGNLHPDSPAVSHERWRKAQNTILTHEGYVEGTGQTSLDSMSHYDEEAASSDHSKKKKGK